MRFETLIPPAFQGILPPFPAPPIIKMIRLELILPHNRAGRTDGTVSNPAWAYKAALPAHENRTLVHHHAVRHIAQKRGRGLVLIGGKIEMNERTAHFAVVFAAMCRRPSGSRRN